MIGYLSGKLIELTGTKCIVSSGGVGYSVEGAPACVRDLSSEEQADLWIHTRVREDAINLFGFQTSAEKSLFELYLGINKVGPKVAMNLVGSIHPQRLWDAILSDDVATFSAVPGIGKTTASKILLELKSKEKQLTAIYKPSLAASGANAQAPSSLSPQKTELDDLSSALSNLGYAKKEVSVVVEQVKSEFLGADFDLLMRECLAKLNKPLQKGRKQAPAKEVFGIF